MKLKLIVNRKRPHNDLGTSWSALLSLDLDYSLQNEGAESLEARIVA